MQRKPTHAGRPMVIAVLPAHAVAMVHSSPVANRFKNGPEVLLRGPLADTVDELINPLPAVARARQEGMPTVMLTARQWLTVATGAVVQVPDRQKTLAAPVEVRLCTWVEAMLFNRQAVTATDEMMRAYPDWVGPPPMDQAQARELVTPLAIPPLVIEELVDQFDTGMTSAALAGLARYSHPS